MALKAFFKTADEIPTELKGYYKQDGNQFVLDVEDMVPKATHDQFRENNRNLNRTLEEEVRPQLKKYQEIGTVEEFEALKQRSDELAEGKLVKSGKLDEAVEKRLEKVNAEHAKEIQKINARAEALQKQLSTMMIDNATMEAATKLGAKETALTDIVARMRSMFKIEDGKLVCYGPNGERDYGKSGTGATIDEKLTELMPNAPHLFKENQGGGGDGSGGGAQHQQSQGGGSGGSQSSRTYNGPNPWKKESQNLTARMKIQKENPQLAKRLKEEAGIRETGNVK